MKRRVNNINCNDERKREKKERPSEQVKQYKEELGGKTEGLRGIREGGVAEQPSKYSSIFSSFSSWVLVDRLMDGWMGWRSTRQCVFKSLTRALAYKYERENSLVLLLVAKEQLSAGHVKGKMRFSVLKKRAREKKEKKADIRRRLQRTYGRKGA